MLDNPYLDNELYIYSYFTDKRYGKFSLRNDSLYREQCRSYPVPVVDVHLFPVRPQRVHHLGIPRSYRQNQGRVSILSISKRWLMRIQVRDLKWRCNIRDITLTSHRVEVGGIGAVRQEDLHGLHVAVLCGQHQWGTAVLSATQKTFSRYMHVYMV